jgi:1-acyl-sn-glycerol-3-phosphate acyltransferase
MTVYTARKRQFYLSSCHHQKLFFYSGGFIVNTEKLVFKAHKHLVKAFVRSMLNYDLLIDELLPAGPKIIVANHPTTSDPFLLPLLVNDPIQILVTEVAFEVPILGKLMTKAGHISVPRTRGTGGHVIPAAVNRLKEGSTIAVFPEGVISPEFGQFSPPRSGAARIALQSGAPVIPVGIHLDPDGYVENTITTDSYSGLARWVRRGSYYLTVGKAMQFEGDVEDRDHVHQVARNIMDAIEFQAHRSEIRMATTHVSWQPLLRRIFGQGTA